MSSRSPDVAGIAAAVEEIGAAWRTDRAARQARRHLERADFDALRGTGLLTLAAPRQLGGLWDGAAESIGPVSSIYRSLAAADPSVALVSSMHPTVLTFWLANPDPDQPEWEAQRQAVFESALAGEQWGTITSEPGSGGDIARTRSTAVPIDAEPIEAGRFLPGRSYAVTGDKHFGSGLGIVDRMITTAVPDGESGPTIFVLDVRDRPWDSTAGLRLVAEWDGSGMAATQSHAMRLESIPSVRLATTTPLPAIARSAGPLLATMFTAVILGVLDEAIATAREQLRPKSEQLRPMEQVEWVRAEQDHWLAVQAYEGAVRSIEAGVPDVAFRAALHAKVAVAELAERALTRLTRVLGGGTYSQRSPFAHWFDDVRALGFLRPPWGLAFDGLLATSFE